ncbi:Porin_4 domain-containing protein [Vibrio chagasii]|nr:Porin_4 domain-containing protein [Vibrio chagasii]CAH7347246.1 Porin_4 domain-containing protein [Vibrio chagasii]
MKKTILTIAVAAASFGAQAATLDHVQFETPELYGHVSVMADKVETVVAKATQKDVTEIDVKRATEIGLAGTVALNHGLTGTYDVATGFDGDEKLELTKLEAGLEHEFGAVYVGKIDSRADKAAEQFDVFGEVFEGTAFEGNGTVRTAEGLAFVANPIADLEVGVQFSGQERADEGAELGDIKAIHGAYTIQGVDLAAHYSVAEFTHTSDKKVEDTLMGVAAGYQYADLYASVAFDKAEYTLGNTTVETDRFALNAQYDINADLAVKAGFASGEYSAMGVAVDGTEFRLAAEYALAKNVAAHAGYAKLDLDGDKGSDELLTAGLTYRF